ncbi:beta-lactamase domain protein [Actinobacteria bacterium OK074]|nr:beta-lactamase domain protein [Actinobacteria bacterium OK074]
MGVTRELGEWHIDGRCTDCDVARQFAPGLIEQVGGRSAVVRQPVTAAESDLLHAAAHACPTRSVRPPGGGLDPARDPFPLPLPTTPTTTPPPDLPTALDETAAVHLCGHNSPRTAGANAYLLRRPDATAMMIDTPRWSEPLAARYEAAVGTVTDVLLTHRDHAAHGRRYADRFGARLWIHEGDLDAAPDADRVLRGIEPTPIGPGVTAFPLPGHTRGSVLYVADERYCFSGDSIYWSRTTADIEIVDSVTWYSVTELAASLGRTVPLLRFEWLLPGHGSRCRLPVEEMGERLARLAERTRGLRPRPVDFGAVRW